MNIVSQSLVFKTTWFAENFKVLFFGKKLASPYPLLPFKGTSIFFGIFKFELFFF